MHDKLQPLPGALFAMPDLHVVELAGRDATTFAQAQFINDLNGLQPGHWQWSGWLTPKGRTVALFAVASWSDDRIWLLLPDLDPSGLAEALRRFVFRSKVAVTVRDDLVVGGAFAKPERAERNRFVEHDGVAEFDLGTPEMPRLLRVGCPAPAVDDAALQRWRMFDLEHGLPRLGPDQSGQWTPQQLSLERIRGFSVKKGCYPGQEIVARTHFLGKAKRGLALLESDRAIAPGAEVTGDARAVGTVVASAGQDGRHLSLAVMPLDREATPLSVGDSPVGERPLREGLAR
ncbi:CAF17-like 4Fe-4S cluster assembly/insertion protein YgfZ [Novilysobacter luteus]|uniref:tRNA-modifying protein YgfZ n=1 Tax=Novilysobacter luteus TaxID=2822368 RepID=A0ABM8UF14_9GAMM|nr:folate-binding protein [Lysobacter luteus]CAG4972647.1 tRNA-modifying protein YgfZ [Lysobacter luteus]